MNYTSDLSCYVAYYRDYQKKGKEYFNLNEAIIQTIDSGFQKSSELNRYKLLEFKANKEFPSMDISPYYNNLPNSFTDCQNKFMLDAKLYDQGGNELFILLVHDLFRNCKTESFSFIGKFNTDFVLNHDFLGYQEVFNNNILLYRISFKATKLLTKGECEMFGNIYIQPNDYTIHKLEYSAYQLGREGKEDKELYNIIIEYGYRDRLKSLIELKYISFNNI